MNKLDRTEATKTCKGYTRTVVAIQEKIFSWAESRTKLSQEFIKGLTRYPEQIKNFSGNWFGMAQAQFVFAKLFSNPTLQKKFCKQVKGDLDKEALDFIESFQENPWRFSLFSVEAQFEGDFYEIKDHITGDELVLYSEAITRMLREGARLFYTLLFPNPYCWQSYGIVSSFKGFLPTDIGQFAAFVDPKIYEVSGAAAVAMYDPVPFLVLLHYSLKPLMMHGNTPVCLCCSEIPVDDPMVVVLPQNYFVEDAQTESGDVLHFNLGEEEYFDRMDFYLDTGGKRAFLSTQSEAMYGKAVERLGPYLNMPEKPQFMAGSLMSVALKEMLDVGAPVSRYEALFTKEATPEEKAELDKLNKALALVIDKVNRGEPVDVKALAAEHDIPLDLLEQVFAKSGNPDGAFPITLEYGIPGFKAPPPIIRRKMAGSFEYNELFSFNSSKAAQSLFGRFKSDRATFLHIQKEDPDSVLDVYPEALDAIYDAFWDTNDRTVMNYTMYLLRENGDKPHAARDYAAEVLRIFHQVLIPDMEPATITSFTRRYARFMYGMMIPAGLAALDGHWELADIRRGSFMVHSTDFMEAWIHW